ncbi:MAG: hypothetical protein ABI036_05460 [Fibrobacteria bacterium]
MTTTAREFRYPTTKRLALSCALAMGMSMFAGCLMNPSETEDNAPTGASVSEPAAKAGTAPKSGSTDPDGCGREWSATAMEWVVICPDIRPAKAE